MGLRIGTNLGALQALRSLRAADAARLSNLQQLATGRRINRGSDDPSGLVLLEQLNAQNRTVSQAIENTQSASNLVATADAGLGEIGELLVGLKAEVVASMNTGALGADQQRALQNSVDQRLAAIDRIASTTRFGDRSLLNGSLGFNVTGASAELTNVAVDTVNTTAPFPLTVNATVTAAAAEGTAAGAIAAAPQAGAATFTVQGNLGSQQITIADGATQQDVIDAVNSVADFTGVEATAAGQIRSREVGSDQFVRIEFNAGTLDGITEGLTFGSDIQAAVNGAAVTGQGNTVRVQDGVLTGQFSVQEGFTGAVAFTIEGGGARFQTGTGPTDAIQVGFAPAYTSVLGQSSGAGTLSSLATGGANSLANNPAGALAVIGAAQTEVSLARSNLGSLEAQLLESNRRALGVQLENLLASSSRIGDLDFAEGVVRRARNDVIFQSALGALRSANLNAGSVLRLLG
jgi:flagellin